MGNLSLGLSVDHVLAGDGIRRLRGDLEGMGPPVCVLTGSRPAARCICAVAGYLEKSGIVKRG